MARTETQPNDDGGIPRSNIVALPPPSYEEALADHRLPTSPVATAASAQSPSTMSSMSMADTRVPPPPSYETLYGRVSQAREKMTPRFFVQWRASCSCCPSGMFSALLNILPVVLIIIGIVYVHDCPQSKFIPIWLIIAGFIWLIRPLMLLTTFVRHTAEDRRLERHRHQHTRNILYFFMVGWFVIGTYFVFRIQPNYAPSQGPHCSPVLYGFVFFLLAAVYALLAFMVGATLLIAVFAMCAMMCVDDGREVAVAAGGGGGVRSRGGASMV